MKILTCIQSLDPKGGGPVENLKHLSEALVGLGHTIEIACLDDPDSTWRNELPFPVHLLGPARLKYGYSKNYTDWLIQNGNNYDCVIVNGIWQYVSFGAWRACKKIGLPYFIFLHGMLDPWFKENHPLKHIKKCFYWPWGDYRVLRDAHAVLFTNENERIDARKSFKLYKCKEKVVKFGTAKPPVFAAGIAGTKEAFFKSHPNLANKKLMVFMGRIHPVKGCDILIEAFANAVGDDGSYHLVIAGPDQDGLKKELLSLADSMGIEERITWTGMLRAEQKWGALNAADVFVMASHLESFGIAVVEALACGTPVIITNKVKIWKEIEACESGIIVNDTVQGLTQGLKQWITMSIASKQSIRERTVPCFMENFEIGHAATDLIDFIKQNLHQ